MAASGIRDGLQTFPLLEHLAAFSEFCQTLLVVYLATLHAAN